MQLQRAFAPSAATMRASRGRLVVLAKESRIGSKPIPIPKGVTVDLKGDLLKVKVCVFCVGDVCGRPPVGVRDSDASIHYTLNQGPNGELSLQLTPFVVLVQVCVCAIVAFAARDAGPAHATHGSNASSLHRMRAQEEGKLVVTRAEQTKKAMAMHGLSR